MALEFSMPPRFEPGTVEKKWYEYWTEKDVFRAERDIKKKPYTIMMPPPNVTGVLHLGHALQDTLMDALTRFKRMQGFNSLWLPGTDHAGIATQAVVEKKVYAEEKLTREDMGREKFLERVWDWKEKHGNTILNQLREIGAGCDWSRTRFTLDEGLSRAVREAFVDMYNKGLIYRGARIVNWDCTLRTAVSDDEIEMVPEKGTLAYIKYPIKDQSGKYLEVATTRPETMFGDTAVAVHPDDERYSDMIGSQVVLPLVNREIPVIADESVDPKFGTGAVKVTPGHDPADFERGQRANLPTLIVLNLDGTLNEHCGPEYEGLERSKARKKVLHDLESLGLLVRVEEHDHNVPQSDRSKTTIEPLVSEQWFVKMQDLVGPALEAYESGEIKFHPERWGRIYEQWLRNVEDWCISRQLWWGHRIPVYYDEDNNPVAAVEAPEVHPESGKKIVRQDEDVLDTWFSSALWPFSTLGWPDQTADLDYFYPTNVLVTDRGIIYLWVARMVIQGYHLVGKKPFSDVFIHPTVLDEYGKRMSKSVGNGIDPIDMIEMYGVDSFRYSMASLATDNQDCRLAIEREKDPAGGRYGPVTGVKQFENSRNFINKIWNACRFALGTVSDIEETLSQLSDDEKKQVKKLETSALEDRWILSQLTETIVGVTDTFERYRFHEATQTLYHFIWDDFCDWYLEVIKSRVYDGKGGAVSKALAQAILIRVLDSTLRLMHPLCPFVTEEIWQELRGLLSVIDGDAPAICLSLSSWPKAEASRVDKTAVGEFQRLTEIIRGIRNIRAEHNIGNKRQVPAALSCPDDKQAASFDEWQREIITTSCRVSELNVGVALERIPGAGTAVIGSIEASVPLADVIDVEMEKKRLVARIEKLKDQTHKLKMKLENQAYVERAPKELVEESREMLRKNVEELARLEANVEDLMKLGKA